MWAITHLLGSTLYPLANGDCHERNNREKKGLLGRLLYLHGLWRYLCGLGTRGSNTHFGVVFDQVAHRSQVPQIALALQGEPVPNLPFEDDQRRRFRISNSIGLD